ncbi:MAG: threonine/serine dehydratase [Dongiaceae bacterium]
MTAAETEVAAPTLAEIAAMRDRLRAHVVETPVHRWRGEAIGAVLPAGTEPVLKLELFQHTGSFKARPALANLLDLSEGARRAGVTAVSAGNHAIAVSYAAKRLGTSAKVVMFKAASPHRIERCRELGAEILLADDVHGAFETVRRIEREEGRSFIHPFEGPLTVLGDATLGLEWADQAPDIEAAIIAIGGGGLAAGVAAALKQRLPHCEIFGVEPEGADTMHRSFAAGSPQSIERVTTIADSLGAPHAAPYSFALCRRYLDGLVKVDDAALRRAMSLLYRDLKLAVEPAGGAGTAALCGPLRDRLAGRRVGVIVCGSNIDAASFARHLAAE